jgi:hypothetical protein
LEAENNNESTISLVQKSLSQIDVMAGRLSTPSGSSNHFSKDLVGNQNNISSTSLSNYDPHQSLPYRDS